MKIKKIGFLLFMSILGWTGLSYGAAQTKTLTLTFNVEPVTVLKVSSSSGGNSVELGPVVSGVNVPVQSLEVRIVTNTSQPYRIYHDLTGDLTNRSGGVIPEGELLMMASNGRNGGTSEAPSMVPVVKGRVLLLTSRPEGGPDQFTLNYAMKNQKTFGAGDYYGNIRIEIE